MGSEITWAEPLFVRRERNRGPDFVDDDRFTHEWWLEHGNFGPPKHQWRSYSRDGEEVARMLLSLQYTSHTTDAPDYAALVWNFEVREDLRSNGEYTGTTIIDQLVEEFNDREIYVGSSPDALGFWQRFGWPMCICEHCGGRDMMVRDPR